jgi:hypothetical protein
MKSSKRLLAVLLGCSALGIAVCTPSQSLRARPTSVAALGATHEADSNPKNLRVLPKDSSTADLEILMDRYGQELGVQCEYCHTQDPQTLKLDYASDDNPAKQTARVMIAMLDEINTKYLAQLDDQKYAVPVSCGNCHQGQADPPTFEPLAQSPGSNPTPDQTVQWAATLSAAGGVKQGSETTLELSGEILDGWHVYAITEPAGGPTALRVTLDENEVAQVAGHPSGTAPRKRHDPSFGLVTQFYTHSFTVRVPVQVKQQPAAGRQLLPVSVRFQTCSDRECQPPTTIHLVVPVEVLPDA